MVPEKERTELADRAADRHRMVGHPQGVEAERVDRLGEGAQHRLGRERGGLDPEADSEGGLGGPGVDNGSSGHGELLLSRGKQTPRS